MKNNIYNLLIIAIIYKIIQHILPPLFHFLTRKGSHFLTTKFVILFNHICLGLIFLWNENIKSITPDVNGLADLLQFYNSFEEH